MLYFYVKNVGIANTKNYKIKNHMLPVNKYHKVVFADCQLYKALAATFDFTQHNKKEFKNYFLSKVYLAEQQKLFGLQVSFTPYCLVHIFTHSSHTPIIF